MKGVSKRVIEITEPQNECIERVLVFLRADCASMRVAQKQAEAEKYVSGLVCYRRRLLPKNEKLVRTVSLALAGTALGALLLYFLL